MDKYFNWDTPRFYSRSSHIQYFYDLIKFIKKSDIYNFANDNTLYESSPSVSVVLSCLEYDVTIVLNWFKVNSLKANLKKFQFIVLTEKKGFLYKCKIEDTYIFSKYK